MNMRAYRPEDLESVMAVANAAWQPIRRMARETLGNQISDLLHPAGDAVSKGLEVKEQLDSGRFGAAVCEHEGRIVGFITWHIAGLCAKICNNAARPDSGVKGVGQTMYQYALDLFRQKGVKMVQVTTGLDWAHAPARRAYERAGFRKHLDSTTYFMELD